METMEFNLLQERWVRVRTQDCTVQEVSLTDALLHAHAYVDLAGEMPTQDAAMLRLQLAVLHTVFSRVDGNGVPAPFEETEDALLRWSELWQLGHFPEQPIRDYLDKWQDRFWLFHPERPFWQVPEAKIGSPFGAKKLNGEVFESENKSSLFSACAGTGKESMDYPQAARIVGRLAQNLALAAGDKNDTGAEAARAQFYFAVDQPFRRWLQGIDPETDEPVEKAVEWQEQAYRLAAELGRQMVEQAGTAAFIGHRIPDKKNREKSYLYTAPKAYNSFLYDLRKLYPKQDEGGTE